MPFHQQTVYKLTGYVYIYAEVEVEQHCTCVQCSEGESSSTHLSFAYVVLSASCYTNRQHISHISLLSHNISQFTLRLVATR